MLRKIFALVAALCFLLAMAGCSQPEETTPVETTEAVAGHVHTVDNNKEWMPWESTDSLPSGEDTQYNYYLTADVKPTKTLSVAAGCDLTLCLNGFTVTAPNEGPIYALPNQAGVYIGDCAAQPGTIYPNGGDAGAFQINGDMSLLTLAGVTIDGTGRYTEAPIYGAVHVNNCNSMVLLDGATIKGCTAVNGPAIYASGKPDAPAAITLTNGTLITENTVTESTEGSAAVIGRYATITVKDSTLTKNVSKAICGVALSFATEGTLNLHNATITGNRSEFNDPTNMQVGAVYIHNGNRNVTISGDTVIEGNTRFDGLPADFYLQRTVRETDPNRWPKPFQLQIGTLTENATINLCPGWGYTYEELSEDVKNLPLLAFSQDAAIDQWQPQWLRIDDWDMQIVCDPATWEFSFVSPTPAN